MWFGWVIVIKKCPPDDVQFITIPGWSFDAAPKPLTLLSYTEMDGRRVRKARDAVIAPQKACGHIKEFIIWVSREQAC